MAFRGTAFTVNWMTNLDTLFDRYFLGEYDMWVHNGF